MKIAVAYLAALGFVASAIVNIASVGGHALGGGLFLLFYFGGIFVVWAPTVYFLGKKFRHRLNWLEATKYSPLPLRILVIATAIYVVSSFLLLSGGASRASFRKGDHLSPKTARIFSGHAMLFYIVSTAVMLSLHNENKKSA